MTGREREHRFRSALSHREYRLLLSGLAVSETGNWLYAAATVIYVLDATGSAAWVGAAAVVRLLPYVLFEPLGGAIADRYDRRKVMIVADLARAGVMTVMALIALSTSTAAVIAVIALTFVNNTFTSPYYPCVTAVTPSIVPERDLAAANALSGTIDNFALAFGPALSVLLLLIGPPPIAIAANGVTFLVSALLVARMRTRGKVGEIDAEPTLLERIGHGAKAIRGSSEAILLIGLAFAFGLTFGQEVVLYGPLAEDSLKIGVDATGLLFAAPGIGGLLVVALAARLAARSRTSAIIAASTFLGGIAASDGALDRAQPGDRLRLAGGGGGSGDRGRHHHDDDVAAGRSQRPCRQRVRHPRGHHGDRHGHGLPRGARDDRGVRPVDRHRVRWRSPARGDARRAAECQGDGPGGCRPRAGVGPDGDAPGTARHLRGRQPTAAGSPRRGGRRGGGGRGFRHHPRGGAQPDGLYAIAQGTLEAHTGAGSDERVIATMREGDYFGEIGLLERRPRTATVVSVTPARLFKIPGADFLRIVNGRPRVSPTLLAVVANRLAESDLSQEIDRS